MHIEKLNKLLTEKFPSVDFTKYLEHVTKFNVGKSTKDVQKHHILPKSIWPEFSSFRLHPWNCSFLSYHDHVIAHLILYELTESFTEFTSLKKMTHFKKILTTEANQDRIYQALSKVKKH